MSTMIRRLRSLWNAPPAAPAPPRRVWRDWVLVAVLPLVAIVEGLLRPAVPAIVPAVALAIVTVPTLLWRRTHPLLMFLLAFASGTTLQLATGSETQLYTAWSSSCSWSTRSSGGGPAAPS